MPHAVRRTPQSLAQRVLARATTRGFIRPGIVLCGPLRAPGSHRLLRGSADIPVPQLSSPTHWKTLSNNGPKLSARIRKNISVSVCDIRATCDLAESARLAHESSQLNPVPLMLIKAERFHNSYEGTE